MRHAGHRHRSRGQALAEFALVLPFLVILLLGGAQIGALLYGQITLDTAARDGARIASQQPNLSGAFSSGAPLTVTKLTVAISGGTSGITSLHVAPLTRAVGAGQPMLLISTSLQGGQAVVTTSAAAVSATSLAVGSFTAQTSYAAGAPVVQAHRCTSAEYASGSSNPACSAVNQSLGFLTGNSGVGTYIAPLCSPAGGVDLSSLGLTSCTTGTSPCQTSSVNDGDVVVALTYDVPIFVPVLGNYLSTPGSSGHTDMAIITNRVTPCTMNRGN
jgi:Flp pilus assembly protein TadG